MPSSDPATLMIRGFDDTQLSAIRNDAVRCSNNLGLGLLPLTEFTGTSQALRQRLHKKLYPALHND